MRNDNVSTTLEFHPSISVHLDTTGLQSSAKLDQVTTVKLVLFRKCPFCMAILADFETLRQETRKDRDHGEGAYNNAGFQTSSLSMPITVHHTSNR